MLRFLEVLGSGYDEWEGGLYRELAGQLLQLANPRPGEACLNIGVGPLTEVIGQRVERQGTVFGIDTSRELLDLTQHRVYANTKLLAMSGEDAFFRANAFHTVVLGRSISYLDDPRPLLMGAHQTLRRGGRLVFFCRRRDLGTWAERVFLGALRELAARHPLKIPLQFFEYAYHAEPAILRALLRSIGFTSVRFTDLVRGGRCTNGHAWDEVMMRCWPAAHLMIGGLGPVMRSAFEAGLDGDMRPLGDDAYRYHHAYMFATAVKDT
ncbi:MAG: hypothetical protein NVSMB29_14260 [Candidatus Dormibacteria bacterium]